MPEYKVVWAKKKEKRAAVALPPPAQEVVEFDPLNRWNFPAHEGYIRLHKDMPILKGYYIVRKDEKPSPGNRYMADLGMTMVELKKVGGGMYRDYWVYKPSALGRNDNDPKDEGKRDYVCRVRPLPLP